MIILNHEKQNKSTRFSDDYLKHKISYCIGLLSVAKENEYTSKMFSNVLEMLCDCIAELKELDK